MAISFPHVLQFMGVDDVLVISLDAIYGNVIVGQEFDDFRNVSRLNATAFERC